MKISIAPYELVPRTQTLNARVSSGSGSREGALLQIETDHGVGYSDLHPWTEFGDLSLKDELAVLASGQTTRLSQRSLFFAQADAKARAANESLFRGLLIPASHFLLPGPLAAGPDILGALTEDGYRVVKIKCGRNTSAELQQFMHLVHSWPDEMRLRLDFNASLSHSAVDAYLARLPKRLKARLEFVEDPCVFSAHAWASLKTKHDVGIALDLEATNEISIKRAVDSRAISHVIIKPAVQVPDDVFKLTQFDEGLEIRFAMTSYLDHPVGQASAAWSAAQFLANHRSALSECGLLSHIVYEPNDFSEMIENEGPIFLPIEGTGFGFDELLRRQKWQRL